MSTSLIDIFQPRATLIGFPKILLVELVIRSNYNNYRSMTNENNSTRELLAEARAIHFAMQHGAITYEQAKLRVEPILQCVNAMINLIAKQHKVKPRHIKFQDLGRNL